MDYVTLKCLDKDAWSCTNLGDPLTPMVLIQGSHRTEVQLIWIRQVLMEGPVQKEKSVAPATTVAILGQIVK